MKIFKIQAWRTALSRLSKREKIILYSAGLVISLVMVDRMVISPISSKIRELNKEIREKESGIKKDLHVLSQKERILAEKKQYASFLSSFKSEEEETTAILKEIENLASKSSVYLIDMRPSGLRGSGAVRKYSINLNCEAQMEQLADFFYNIETSDELLIIEKYEISPKSRDSSVARCSMSIVKMVVP